VDGKAAGSRNTGFHLVGLFSGSAEFPLGGLGECFTPSADWKLGAPSGLPARDLATRANALFKSFQLAAKPARFSASRKTALPLSHVDKPRRTLLPQPPSIFSISFQMSILLTIGVLILIFVSVIMGLLVLMQRSKDGGVGAALGGGMAEATFGAETSTILSKTTIKFAIAFFILAFVLYLCYIYQFHHGGSGVTAPAITAPAIPAPAIPAPAMPAAPAQTPVPAIPAPGPAQ
jgi:preprotein translocase subunit SecG